MPYAEIQPPYCELHEILLQDHTIDGKTTLCCIQCVRAGITDESRVD